MDRHTKAAVLLKNAATDFASPEIAEKYIKYRSLPPTSLINTVMEFLKANKGSGEPLDLVVDVGCGSGQNTQLYTHHFTQVVGLDVSSNQLAAARARNVHPNVTYKQFPAECLPFEDGSVDLITCCVSAHWFDINTFFDEVDRVLRPGGVLACYSHLDPTLMYQQTDLSHYFHELWWEEWKQYIPKAHARNDDQFLSFPQLYPEELFIRSEEGQYPKENDCTVADVLGYLESTSWYNKATLDLGTLKTQQRLATLKQSFLSAMKTTDESTTCKMTLYYFIRMWRKPST